MFNMGDFFALAGIVLAAAAIYMLIIIRKSVNQPMIIQLPQVSNPAFETYMPYYGETDRLRKQVDMLRKMLEAKEREFKDRLKELSEKAQMLQSLNDAISAGAVRLKCPEHKDAEVTLLVDGTLICSEGHRLWPPGEEK